MRVIGGALLPTDDGTLAAGCAGSTDRPARCGLAGRTWLGGIPAQASGWDHRASRALTLDGVPHDAPTAALVGWTTAWLAGAASHDDAVAVIQGPTLHGVVGLPGEPGETTLGWALGRLRVAGVTGLRMVLPVPGDIVGLPGPATLRAAALSAGQAAVCLGADLALVPLTERHESPFDGTVTTVRWTCHAAEALPPYTEPTAAEAEYALRAAVREAVSALAELDVARWRPELAGPLQELREAARTGRHARDLPPGYSGRASGLLVLADSVGTVVQMAAEDEGSAVTSAEMRSRTEALRELGHAARRARVAAYNSILHPDAWQQAR